MRLGLDALSRTKAVIDSQETPVKFLVTVTEANIDLDISVLGTTLGPSCFFSSLHMAITHHIRGSLVSLEECLRSALVC